MVSWPQCVASCSNSLAPSLAVAECRIHSRRALALGQQVRTEVRNRAPQAGFIHGSICPSSVPTWARQIVARPQQAS